MTLQTQIDRAQEAQATVDAQRALEALADSLPELEAERARQERRVRREVEISEALLKATTLLSGAGYLCASWHQRFNAVMVELDALAATLPETQEPIAEAKRVVGAVARPGGSLAAQLWADAGGGDASLALPRGTEYSKALGGRVMFAIRKAVSQKAAQEGERRPSSRASVYSPERGF